VACTCNSSNVCINTVNKSGNRITAVINVSLILSYIVKNLVLSTHGNVVLLNKLVYFYKNKLCGL